MRWLALVALLPGTAHAQAVSERLSFFERPRSFDLRGTTVVVQGIVDGGLRVGERRTDAALRTRTVVSAERQFSNAMTGLAFGELRTGLRDDENGRNRFDRQTIDWKAGAGLRGVWGTLVAGRVTERVERLTDRLPGVGNASLRGDDTGTTLGAAGGAYELRLGPAVLGAAVDADGHVDVGVSAKRPFGTHDPRLTLRLTHGVYEVADRTVARSDAVALGLGTTYGAVYGDIRVGAARLKGRGFATTLRFVEAGLGTKRGPWSFSAEGRLARTGNTREAALALGARLDVARGLSVNFGYNAARAKGTEGGIALARSRNEGLVTLRYEY